MASLNQANIIGYVGEEPRIINTQNGKKMASFSIATTEKGFTKTDGTVVPDKTEWHNIIVFGKTAEVVEKFVRKGSMLYVQGKLSTRQYEKDGQKRFVTEIVVDVLQLLDRKPNDAAQQPTAQTQSQYPANYSTGAYPPPPARDPDLPF